MGIADFYLNAEVESNDVDCIHELIKSKKIYNNFISYYIESTELGINAARVSFFPMCEIIYDLLYKINQINPIKSVETRKEKRSFDFESNVEFFCWMYSVWKEPLDYFNKECGAFLVRTADYYNKATIKLRKKYYVKFSLDD